MLERVDIKMLHWRVGRMIHANRFGEFEERCAGDVYIFYVWMKWSDTYCNFRTQLRISLLFTHRFEPYGEAKVLVEWSCFVCIYLRSFQGNFLKHTSQSRRRPVYISRFNDQHGIYVPYQYNSDSFKDATSHIEFQS